MKLNYFWRRKQESESGTWMRNLAFVLSKVNSFVKPQTILYLAECTSAAACESTFLLLGFVTKTCHNGWNHCHIYIQFISTSNKCVRAKDEKWTPCKNKHQKSKSTQFCHSQNMVKIYIWQNWCWNIIFSDWHHQVGIKN